MNKEKLSKLVNEFRDAIEFAKDNGDFARNRREVRFQDFPNGCCDDASELLGYYLEQNGFTNIMEVTGHYYGEDKYDENKCDHVWLKIENTIIDITGDQRQFNLPIFCNYNIPVYIGKEDDFHAMFEDKEIEPYINFQHASNDDYRNRFEWLYKTIFKYI